MFLLVAFLIGIAVAWALGGDLARLARVQIRGAVLLFAALGVQLVIFTELGALVPAAARTPLHVATYLAAVAFLVANLRLPWVWMVALGVAANMTAIFANGGYMPVSPEAWSANGRPLSDFAAAAVHHNNGITETPRVAWLGDIFPLPVGLPMTSILSPGDLLILVGLVACIATSCSRGPRRRMPLLRPLRERHFRRLLVARGTSLLGDWLTTAALVGWAYATTHSTAWVAAMLTGRIVAMTLGGLAAAPLLDRVPGSGLLRVVEVIRGGLTLAMIPFAVGGDLVAVLALSALSCFLAAACRPGATSVLTDIVRGDDLHAGNAVHSAALEIAMIAGTAVGGAVVGLYGIGIALALDAATFLAAAVLYPRVAPRPSGPPVATQGGGANRRMLLIEIAGDRLVLTLVCAFTLTTTAIAILNSSLPAVLAERFADPEAYGYALSAVAGGALVGQLAVGALTERHVLRRTLPLAFLVVAAATWGLAEAPLATTAFLMLAILGAADGATDVVYSTLLQRAVPRTRLAGTFAMAGSVQNVGMIAGFGLAVAIASLGSAASALAAVAGLAVVASLLTVPQPGRRSDREASRAVTSTS